MDRVVAQSGAVVFRALILRSRKTATGIRVPEEVVEHRDGGKRPRVHVTLDGCSCRSAVLLVIAGPVADDHAVRALCERLGVVIGATDADAIVVDVGALPANCRSVEALARMQLTARRAHRGIRLRRTSPALQDLLDFAGLADVVPG